MNPIAIDPKLRLSGVLLGFVVAAAALLGGYATVDAISDRLSVEGAPPLIGLMSLVEGDASLAQGDFETASSGDAPIATRSPAGRSEIAESLPAPIDPTARPFKFWPDRRGRLSAKDWIRTQLVRLPDGAAAYMNSSSQTTWIIQLVRTFESADGRICREFSVTAEAPARSDELFDAACRGALGTWKSNLLGVL